MKDLKDTCKLAVVQAAPVMFDKTACIEKALKLINECTANGAELIVFPELFIPGYPYGMTFGFRVGSRNADGRKDWKVYYDNSILANGPEMQQLIEKAKEQGIYLSIGYSERDAVTGTLYNSNMMIAPDGTAMNHRKLKPTGSERVVWGDADRDYFLVMETPWGPMGNLICWESYMPLARSRIFTKKAFRCTFPRIPTITRSGRTRSAILLLKDTAISSTATCSLPVQTIQRQRVPVKKSQNFRRLPAAVAAVWSIRSAMWFLIPSGIREGIIYAELDMQKVPASKMEHDVCGHYARPDVLKLQVEDK